MARILITSGPTRQYLDPVRYLTNASSGRMGKALANAAALAGHEVIVISGPVEVEYDKGMEVVPIVSTEEMLDAAKHLFESCDGAIGVAAPCDYRPTKVEAQKISKTGEPLTLQLIETPDVVATLGARKRSDQWVVGFALETDDHRFRAIRKLEEKSCDLIVLNSPEAMNSPETRVEILNPAGNVVRAIAGAKSAVAAEIVTIIDQQLVKQVNLSN
ncbi:MAG: phosphopantothenoylcysteine decarboxylase [Pirellulaceae bacterium]|nr:phosphopantothenoylcysteine decarboxylase [Pirellulaceae bacterium]